jgi:collagen type I/II/III/V/XI/XXIV/XXVII alpha
MSTQTTPKQQQTVGDTTTDWSQTVTFGQFDPSLGTLQGIDVELTADVTGSVAIESMEAAPSTVTVSLPSTVSVNSPTNVLLASVALDPSASAALGAYDGSTDYAGASGTTLAGLLNTGTAETSWQAGTTDLGAFIGTGSVPLSVDASTQLHVDGPANLQLASQASAGASVSLQYDYTPSGGGSSGSSSGVVDTFGNGPPAMMTLLGAITTAPQVFTFADRTTGWQDSLAIKQFDTSLGTLESVNIVLSGDLLASVAAENGDATASNVATSQTATLSLDLPGTTEAVAATVSDSMLLVGYDGTQDFAGTSGRIDHGLTQTTTIGSQLTGPGGLAAFTGQGSVAVPIAASGTSSLDGPGNLLARLIAEAGATVTVSYSYLPTLPVTLAGSGSETVTGPVAITNGGTWNTGGLAISDASGGGAVTVSGTGSTIDNVGDVTVGAGDFGWLLVTAGGLVQTSSGTDAIASGSGSDGSNVVVNGTGSTWQSPGPLLVGDGGAGSLAISAGGTVTFDRADIGVLAGGSGIVSVVGTGSNLTLAGSLIVGDATAAELSILSGAVVTADNADIGVQAGSSGNVDIEGNGSQLNIAHSLSLGDAGTAVLTLGSGTELTVHDNINIGASGKLIQFGGIIDPSVVNNTGRAGGKGAITATVSIVNTGTLFAASGTETLVAPVITGTGVLEIDTGGNLTVNAGSVAATQTVTFTDGTGILTIGTLGGFGATIGDFITGDAIIVQGTSIASDSFDASTHVLTLFDGSSATIGTLQFGSSVTGSNLGVNGTGGIGTAPCFVAGTRISTERGEVAVEDLRVGDRVQVVLRHPHPNPPPLRGRGGVGTEPPLPRSGGGLGWGSREVIWIGHRTVDCTRHPEPHKVWPVRVSAHAFGPGRPCRDLYLSPDHAVFVVDALIPVKYLIDGAVIAQVPVDEVTYYHVELPRHDVLLADGLPTESYLGTGDRGNFANGGGPIALHPDFASRVWEAEACAPLVVTGPELEAARRWVNAFPTRPATRRRA